MKTVNRYTFYARYIPAFITLLPVTLTYFFSVNHYEEYSLADYLTRLTFIMEISGTFILTYFFSMLVRELGTTLERKYFIGKHGFPTTYLLLYSNTRVPSQTKHLYTAKLQADYGILLLNPAEEASQPEEAKGLLNQAGRIISTRYQQNPQVKDANIAYGFARNVSGGLMISLPFSLFSIGFGYWQHDYALMLWSVVLSVIFLLLTAFHKEWIIRNAEKYAEKIIATYLSDKGT